MAGSTRVGGGADEKARIERLCLSPCVKEPLNLKVIKRFVPELRSRYVFFEFRDSYLLSLRTFDVRFTHSQIMAMEQLVLISRKFLDRNLTASKMKITKKFHETL